MPAALEGENESHDNSATSHKYRADLLSDGNMQLDPNQSMLSHVPASFSLCSLFPFNSIKS